MIYIIFHTTVLHDEDVKNDRLDLSDDDQEVLKNNDFERKIREQNSKMNEQIDEKVDKQTVDNPQKNFNDDSVISNKFVNQLKNDAKLKKFLECDDDDDD